MRYKIYYQDSGASPLEPSRIPHKKKNNTAPVDSHKLMIKLKEHKDILDKELGVDKWAYTGSCAVIAYGLSEEVDISKIPEPNDINVIYETDLSHVNLTKVGDYQKDRGSKYSSTVFYNSKTDEELDIIPVKKLLKNNINGLPLAKLYIMNNIYKDLENGPVIGTDLIKSLALDEVKKKNPNIDGDIPKKENEFELPVAKVSRIFN